MLGINSLMSGYKKFYYKYFLFRRSIYKELVKNGQSPKALVIACCDSRVDPALVTNAAPGDIFVVRNIANFVPCFEDQTNKNLATGAAIEFAVKYLDVDHIILLGHNHCGGIKALVNPETLDELPLVKQWVKYGEPALDLVRDKDPSAPDYLHHCELAGIKVSFENLKKYPFVAEKLAAKSLTLHGWYLDLATGHILDYDYELDKFTNLV